MFILNKFNIKTVENQQLFLNYVNIYYKIGTVVIYDYRNRIRILNKKKRIPQNFLSSTIFISSTSFQQNHKILSTKIRSYVYNNISKSKCITCIGGESYLYGLVLQIQNIYHYTNCKSIYNDLEFNNKFYKKNICNNLINYNNYENYFGDNNFCIINLSRLYEKLIIMLNDKNYQKIIIIKCNHNDFWKKIRLLYNYKIISRERFICEKLNYFITVNIFIKKTL